MNISTKSSTLGTIKLNNIKYSKVNCNTNAVDLNSYEEIDYNVPNASINIDEELKELENIRDILVEHKNNLMPRYESWRKRWENLCKLAEPLEEYNRQKYMDELIKSQVNGSFSNVPIENDFQSINGQFNDKQHNIILDELLKGTRDYVPTPEEIKRNTMQMKVNSDPHKEFYQKIWLNYSLINDDKLINQAKEIDPDCSENDYYLVWASSMSDKDIHEFLSESSNPADLFTYFQTVDYIQQKKDLLAEKSHLDEEISSLDVNIRQLNELIKEYPYLKIMESEDFKKYLENFDDSDRNKQLMNIFSKSTSSIFSDFDYRYLSEQEKLLYHYLMDTEGQDSVDAFMEAYQDKINQIHGYELAKDFIDSLDLDSEGNVKKGLANFLGVSVEGLDDGINTFFEGIENAIINNDELTANDYKKMIVLQYLQENSDYEFLYSFNSALGNMIPAIVASITVSILATPAAGATTLTGSAVGTTVTTSSVVGTSSALGSIVGTSLIGLSAFGNAKHQALVGGHDVLSSTLYGLFVGTSEATLGYFLGKVPGISKACGFTLKSLLMEGVEEFSQEWIDAGLRAVILEEEVDWSSIPEQSVDAFMIGVLMSGFLNGGQKVVNLGINGVQYNINVEDVLLLIKENKNMNIKQAMEIINPGIFDLFKRKKNSNTSNVNNTLIENMLKQYDNDYYSAFADIIYEENKTKSINQVRETYRILVKYLTEKGETFDSAIEIVAQAGIGAINYRGFNTRQVNLNGNNIMIREQKHIDYTKQPFNLSLILQNLSQLPIEFQGLVHTINIYDTFNPHDLYWEYKYNMANFCSQATGGDGVINFYAGSFYNDTVIPHEIAHTYDHVYAERYKINGRISESPLWRQAMMADQAINGLNGISDYARDSNSPVEDFADSVARFYMHPEILNRFPNRKALLTQILPQHSEVIVNYNLDTTINLEAAKAFDLVLNAMIRKYGKDIAIINIQTYLDTGRLDLITSSEGARNTIMKIPLDEIKSYIRSINQGSLDISQLVKEK